ncbi:MAG: hypothetical protein EOM24_07030 [Chloroflexia bacterium]|nr:hypothetical protein [Chloroflexia bacterium]
MQSDLIGKIEKARRYAAEPDRVKFIELRANFNGGNSTHEVVLREGHWSCDCSFFQTWGTCAHVMAMQRMLNPMLDEEARQAELAIAAPADLSV